MGDDLNKIKTAAEKIQDDLEEVSSSNSSEENSETEVEEEEYVADVTVTSTRIPIVEDENDTCRRSQTT